MRKTPEDIRDAKGNAPIVCLTAYSAPMAALLDPHCDVLLVGDSVGMVLYGMDSTQEVTPDIMIAHGRAVVRASQAALVVVDMPYGSYETDAAQAVETARRLMTETECGAVKLEGHADKAAAIVSAGVPVMAHIGLLPQSAPDEGGYKIKGKSEEDAARLVAEAQAMEKAGAFAVVIEGTVEPVARAITKALSIPTIGIGASPSCDGQVLVTEDMLGLLERVPKFVKKYAELNNIIDEAVAAYAAEVRGRLFPGDDHVYHNR